MPIRQAFSPAKVIFVGAGVLLQVSNVIRSLVPAVVTFKDLGSQGCRSKRRNPDRCLRTH
jgi:hypothetical protein